MEAWDAVSRSAPFAFRAIVEIRSYIEEAEALGVAWEEALDAFGSWLGAERVEMTD